MHTGEKIYSHLTINGYTINPVKSKSQTKSILMGLCGYGEKHACDFKKEKNLVHTNYLGKVVGEPKIDYIVNRDYQGITAHFTLENGYFTLKIIDNVFPAEIQFTLHLNGYMEDCSLIIDHLSAPTRPNDGFGMFDSTYSLTYTNKKNHFISKIDNKITSYYVNDYYDFDNLVKTGDEDYEVILNEINELQCAYCNQKAESIVFCSFPRISIPVCDKDKEKLQLQGKELGAKQGNEPDVRHSSDKHRSITLEHDNIKYTTNVRRSI
jgi:hypothetical protein